MRKGVGVERKGDDDDERFGEGKLERVKCGLSAVFMAE